MYIFPTHTYTSTHDKYLHLLEYNENIDAHFIIL